VRELYKQRALAINAANNLVFMVYLFDLNYNFVLIEFLLVRGTLKRKWSDHAVFVYCATLNITLFLKV